MLAIDLGSDVLPALALGTEPPEPETMNAPPRSPKEPLFTRSVLGRILFLGGIQALGVTTAFFWKIHTAGIPYAAFTADNPIYREALTMTQAGIVVSQVFNGLTVRSDRLSIRRLGVLSNPRLLAAQALAITAMCAISYAPPLQQIFNTAPLSPLDWAILTGFGAVLLAADETRKALVRAHAKRRKENT
ncbi:cation-translocating P-type ATPase C-terminal domain-containing protein [Actinoplanes sp. KI2]|uniref:cation-translocating P-type ATPase C-terminal domain-containing protein n=1 Tax=Actinoplanes sp. KI2 TaxID=2983315 RepID=UPI0021D56BD2|nr:cation-translocating P-type ATPase C-terminal domain-containing protein [Actinoplanes sp. KI2]MCU7729454.1 cation-translocating P-type ATPase C-terminal domain-containing protein [Actinoplanes sp. KI2]